MHLFNKNVGFVLSTEKINMSRNNTFNLVKNNYLKE